MTAPKPRMMASRSRAGSSKSRPTNRVLSKAQILDHVWNYDFNGEAGIVESYISYLRRKIDTPPADLPEDGDWPPLIHTKRGVGYLLRLPPDAA